MGKSIPEITIIEEKEDWKNLLEDIGYYDFYHTYDYHHLSKGDQEKPILIKYQEDDGIIGLPMLIRKIFDTDFYDVTSVYGYAGPLQKNISANFDNTCFIDYLKRFFLEKNIVTVFSRLNPFIKNQELILNGLGEIKVLSKVVNIDITNPLDQQRALFSKTTKRYINKTRRACSVRIANSKEDIKIFKEIYYENMDRVGAKAHYYFDEAYFHGFHNSTDFKTEMLFAIHEETNKIISAAMMIKTNDIIQYHISGTRNDYLYLTPIRLLIDEMRIKGTENKYRYFNLGGGLGSSEDLLFRFKSSFSKDFKDFKIWKYVVNHEAYNQLNNQFSDPKGDKNFFPMYRNI